MTGLQYKIAITLVRGIGTALAKNLIAYLGSEEAVFTETPQALAKIPGIGEVLSREITTSNALQRAAEEIEFIEKNKIECFYFNDKNYPYRLKECSDAPIMLYSKGKGSLNEAKFIGIVGTRNATEQGRDNCRRLIEDLSRAMPNAVIVSGLAYGVDICAHKAALDAGMATFGVVGHGLDRIYPAMHRSTAVRMLENGRLLTEYLSRTNPDRQNFVQRNRIIAGMCDATVVVESAARGGALLTADAATSYNRDVFAFPGRVGDEWSAGCNALIKSNRAALIECADDLLNFMCWEKQDAGHPKFVQTTLFPDLNENEMLLFTLLRQFPDGLQLNDLAIRTAMPVSKVSAMLLGMEFKGLVRISPGNLYRIVK